VDTKKLLFGSLAVGSALAISRVLSAKSSSRKTVTRKLSYSVIDDYVEEQVHRLKIPGAYMAIVEGDQIVHQRGFGRARPGGEAPTPQTPFFIGSVTKSFTALAIMQLMEAGKVELDAPVRSYLPWFRVADPQASVQMTVHHLLNHTSGLPMSIGEIDLTNFDENPGAGEKLVRSLSTVKLTRPVGSKFDYNNTNYNILGLIIETVSGETYTDYIQNHIFNPLGMKHSYTSREIAKQNGLAMGYRYWFGYPFAAPNLSIPLGSLPSGQLISCAEDLAHYLIAYLNGGRYGEAQILSPAGIKEMQRGTSKIHEMGRDIGFYAMGWICTVTGDSHIVSHSGIVPDFGAFAGLVPEQKKGIVLLFNANHAMIKMTLDEFCMGATERLAGETPSKTLFDIGPWLMRGMSLIPVLQVAGVILTLRRLHHWQKDSQSRPSGGLLWTQHILLPTIPNLLLSLTLVPVLGKMRGWMLLFMPDFAWIAQICGGFAGMWSILRTGLLLRTIRKSLPN
jgi:CubicO group peptidase (beta-lactamase class C family)